MELNQPSNPMNLQQSLPNSNAVLVLGIISIAACWCWGFPGLICGIIALVLSSKSEIIYRAEPNNYTPGSYSNLKAGKVCAIIGVCLSGFIVLNVIIKLIFGAVLLGFLSSILPFLEQFK